MGKRYCMESLAPLRGVLEAPLLLPPHGFRQAITRNGVFLLKRILWPLQNLLLFGVYVDSPPEMQYNKRREELHKL